MSDAPTAKPVFRRASPDEAPALLRVIEAAFETWPPFPIDVSPLDFLRWKMTPPGHPHDLHAVIELNQEIVGVMIRWIGRAELLGTEYPYDFGVDFCVSPGARGLGLGSLLRDGDAGRSFGGSIGFDTVPANQLAREMYDDRGPVHRPLTVWAHARSPRAFFATHRADGITHLAGAVASTLTGQLRSRTAGSSEFPGAVEAVSTFDERATDLWNRVRGDFDLARVRTAEYLNWRYRDPRAGRIAAYQLVDGDRITGYVAIRHDGPDARVLDLVSDPTVPGAATALLRRAVGDLEKSDAVIECLFPVGHRDEPALRAAGFLPTGQIRQVRATRARHAAVPRLIEVFTDPAARVHLTAGDFDHQ